jgi:hypothetical protein
VPSSLLRIKEVEISFDADLVRLSNEESKRKTKGDTPQDDEGVAGAAKKVGHGRHARRWGVQKKAGTVHVVLKVEDVNSPKAWLRWLTALASSREID